jgi:GrpB-like predicted nucleotidyltransferase (UPF0157 family)
MVSDQLMGEVEPRAPPKPKTEKQIVQATVGQPPKRLNGRVVLAEYDPEWPRLFARERERIKSVLHEEAIAVEHIGSTSVPGLAAKPIIDVLLVVANSADEESYVPALEAAGYVLRIREPDWHEHRMFKGPDADVNLHVFSQGEEEIERMLAFRDWLRGNPTERDLYLREKRQLAHRNWRYVQNYADAKSEVIESIMARALSSRR